MKKIFLLFATVGVLIACDPVHEKIDNGIDNANHITADELKAMSTVIVDKVNKIAGEKTYPATKDAPITLIENIDVTDCDGITVYFDDKTIEDALWTISVEGGEPEKILKNAAYYRYKVPEGKTNVSNIVLKYTGNNGKDISIYGIYKSFGYHVAPGKDGEYGNVVTCETSAPVNARWDIAGKEFLGNFATRKLKVTNENGIYAETPYTIKLTAICPDGTKLVVPFDIKCDKVSDPLVKYYIYGDPNRDPSEEPQPPFSPGAWDAAAMRFSSTEGAHLPTIPDDVYFGLKTLIVDISDANDPTLMIHNGWWSNTYYDNVKWKDGLNEVQITKTIANECAKGGEGRDLQFLLKGGSFTLNAVYYEE